MRLMSQAVAGQLLTYAVFLAVTLALSLGLPSYSNLFQMPLDAAMGNCLLLLACFIGLKLHFVYAAVPLVGYEIVALFKGMAGGYTMANLPHLIIAIFAFVILASLTGRVWQRCLMEAATHDPGAYCPRPRGAFARRAASRGGYPHQY